MKIEKDKDGNTVIKLNIPPKTVSIPTAVPTDRKGPDGNIKNPSPKPTD